MTMSKLIKNNQCHCTVMPGCDEPQPPDYLCYDCKGTGKRARSESYSLIEKLMLRKEQTCQSSKESL